MIVQNKLWPIVGNNVVDTRCVSRHLLRRASDAIFCQLWAAAVPRSHLASREREREMSPGRQLPRQMQPRDQIADGNQRICNVQLLLSRICNLCRAQIFTHNRGQEHCGFLGGALWPKCGLLYLSFTCSRQWCSCSKQKPSKQRFYIKVFFFQNIFRISLSAMNTKIVHMVKRFLHKQHLLACSWPLL